MDKRNIELLKKTIKRGTVSADVSYMRTEEGIRVYFNKPEQEDNFREVLRPLYSSYGSMFKPLWMNRNYVILHPNNPLYQDADEVAP